MGARVGRLGVLGFIPSTSTDLLQNCSTAPPQPSSSKKGLLLTVPTWQVSRGD